ncbi:hypothetical protein ACLB2K_059532 [Fragaria x ananassa]
MEGEGEGRVPSRGRRNLCFLQGSRVEEPYTPWWTVVHWFYNNSALILADYDDISDPGGCSLDLLEAWITVRGLRVAMRKEKVLAQLDIMHNSPVPITMSISYKPTGTMHCASNDHLTNSLKALEER